MLASNRNLSREDKLRAAIMIDRFLVEKTHASRENYLILSARDRPAGEPRLADPPGLVPLTLRVLVGDAEATGRP